MANVDPGTYRARAKEWALCDTQEGKPQIAVLFEILDDDDHKGRRLTWYGAFTEKTTERTLEALRGCGWTGDHLADLRGMGTKDVEIVIDMEQGLDGKDRVRIRWVNPIWGLSVRQPMSADKIRDLAERTRGAAETSKKPRAKAPAGGAPAEAPADFNPDEDYGY